MVSRRIQGWYYDQINKKICISKKEIDQLVYKLYGLTEEEIKIVENFGLKNN
jgi:hypothetical protein